MSGEQQLEEILDLDEMMGRLDAMKGAIPPLPDYLQAKPLASAIARGLSHAEHKAEWEAKHGPII